MPIPPIAPYAIPALPPPAAEHLYWRVSDNRAALLIHDMQSYFVAAYDESSEPAASVIANIAAIRARCTELGVPVIYTVQPPRQHPARRGLLLDRWGEGIVTDDEARVIPALAPASTDIEITKWRYSAFARTDLRELLVRLGRDQLIVTGVYAHIGCQLTAADAFMNDVQPFFVSDAVADFSAIDHSRAVEYVDRTCGVALTTRTVLDSLKSTT